LHEHSNLASDWEISKPLGESCDDEDQPSRDRDILDVSLKSRTVADSCVPKQRSEDRSTEEKEMTSHTRSAGRLLLGQALAVSLLLSIGFTMLPMQLSDAAFPGSNGKIAFVSDREGQDEIYVMNPDGSGQTRLTDNIARDGDPAWSPDGSRIAFTRNKAGAPEIYVMNADGSNQTRLASRLAEHPTWSPDGSKIAFDSAQYGSPQIYVMNADGSHPVPLTPRSPNTQEGWVDPAWSPDGSKIAAVEVGWPLLSRTGSILIGQFNLPHDLYENNELLCPSAGHGCGDPAWSPDGSRIALTANFDSWTGSHKNYNIRAGPYNVDVEDDSYKTLTKSGENRHPAWSPDGSKVAFASNRDGSWEIYVMNADGSGQTRLTFKGGREPDWQPTSPATTSTIAQTTSVWTSSTVARTNSTVMRTTLIQPIVETTNFLTVEIEPVSAQTVLEDWLPILIPLVILAAFVGPTLLLLRRRKMKKASERRMEQGEK